MHQIHIWGILNGVLVLTECFEHQSCSSLLRMALVVHLYSVRSAPVEWQLTVRERAMHQIHVWGTLNGVLVLIKCF
jgi:hypothetical protein